MILLWIITAVVVVLGFAAFFGAPYVPSHASQVRRAFTDLRPLTDKDVVVDLGSGDGVVLRHAIEYGAGRAIGYEINPLFVWVSRGLSLKYRDRITIQTANMWHSHPPDGVSVVYVFGVGRDMKRLVALIERWAVQSEREIECLVYGHELPGIIPVRQVGAHRLYRFTALHRPEAQV